MTLQVISHTEQLHWNSTFIIYEHMIHNTEQVIVTPRLSNDMSPTREIFDPSDGGLSVRSPKSLRLRVTVRLEGKPQILARTITRLFSAC